MDAPPFALTIAYWLHMLATVVWIGSLASLALIILPAARKSLPAREFSAFLLQIQSRLQPVGWFSLAVLAVTGMFQMSANPAYEGFLAITNGWAAAILIKHLVIGLMLLSSGTMTWVILPGLRRAALLRAADQPVAEDRLSRLERQETRLLLINLVLSVIVLALTAWARAA
jgi:uncharacterized membrane protein